MTVSIPPCILTAEIHDNPPSSFFISHFFIHITYIQNTGYNEMSKQIPHGKIKHNSFIMHLILVTQLVRVDKRKKHTKKQSKKTSTQTYWVYICNEGVPLYCGFPFPLPPCLQLQQRIHQFKALYGYKNLQLNKCSFKSYMAYELFHRNFEYKILSQNFPSWAVLHSACIYL